MEVRVPIQTTHLNVGISLTIGHRNHREVGNGEQEQVKIKNAEMDMHMDMKLSLHKELQTNLVMN